jgi:hypothetical protein
VKRQPVAESWRLDAEDDGHARLAQARAIRVPRLLGHGATESEVFL